MKPDVSTSTTGFDLKLEESNGKSITVARAADKVGEGDWNQLHEQVRKILVEDAHDWRFDLTSLIETDSRALGMIVTLAATIENRKARSEFIVKKGSILERTMRLTKLDRILNITSE